jgi:hypothetical protein
MFVRQMFGWGLACTVLAVAVAMFPSNYEIVGMEETTEPPAHE